MDRGCGRGEERMRDEVLEADAVLGVPLEQVVEEVGELRRGAAGNPWCQTGVPLVELLQSLRGLGLEGCLASETLEDNCAEGPEIGLCIVLK
jgi:hypothetical protein